MTEYNQKCSFITENYRYFWDIFVIKRENESLLQNNVLP
jgi:hypothetical protein